MRKYCIHYWEDPGLDNNDLNQVVVSSGFSENKGLGGELSLVGSQNLVLAGP